MAEEELVAAYRRGEIGPVTFVRKLIKLGVSASLALGMALSMGGTAQADHEVCLECPPVGPGHAVNAIATAAIGIANNPALENSGGEMPEDAAVNVAMHNANSAEHLLEGAANLIANNPGNTPP